MADIKTHLRELSVVLGIKDNKDLNIDKITPTDFTIVAKAIISNDISMANNIASIDYFNQELRTIIKNGVRLGRKIVEKNLANPNLKIIWSGADSQKNDPIDLLVGDVGFSLKEDSYILENMGLYKYLNLMTNSDFGRGLHVFEHFASQEYNGWFQYSWQKLLDRLPRANWSENNGRYVSEIQLVKPFVLFILDGKILSRLPTQPITIQQYIGFTKALDREKVFAKWISSELSNDTGYLVAKNKCSITAGNNLCVFVNKKLNPINIARLLQIYDKDYYYAKSTQNQLDIFHVPNRTAFLHEIKVHEVKFSVPTSQLNILTEIENKNTGNYLVFRNECRFSHGQFNGTPEAKMYYERGNDLSVIYNRIV